MNMKIKRHMSMILVVMRKMKAMHDEVDDDDEGNGSIDGGHGDQREEHKCWIINDGCWLWIMDDETWMMDDDIGTTADTDPDADDDDDDAPRWKVGK